MAVGCGGAGQSGICGDDPAGIWPGVGRVGPYFEQGNWYRGGAVQMLFIAWIYGEQNQVRPMFPPNTSQDDLIRASKAFDLSPQMPPVDWSQALRHLPEMNHQSGGRTARSLRGQIARHTGGAMIERTPTTRPGTKADCGTTT